eukprot:TRINITY_DN40904_c0_g1_i1.p1 TRINITY_DN40904_c0_g1~~TRINITY_DN40904_c0_g1_i1.p1  ORF type:complete len:484 (+),score=151.97 TRINITY_DN40904_c0_g1_i1:79-1452(+)
MAAAAPADTRGALLWAAAAGAAAALAAQQLLQCVWQQRQQRGRRKGPAPGTRLVPHQALRAAVRRILQQAGSGEEEQRVVADHLVDANLAGHDSHGVQMMRKYMLSLRDGWVSPNVHAVEAGSAEGPVVSVDCQGGFGPVVAREAMRLGIAAAKRHGVCVLAARRCFHIGRAGPYADMAADHGLAAVLFVSAVGHPPLVAPFGGAQARLLTNPFSVSVPAAGREHISVDFATSIVANGKLQAAVNRGDRAELGVLIDEHGRPTDDPRYPTGFPVSGASPRAPRRAGEFGGGGSGVLPGAILPFGMHKGSGLGLACELLGAALTGSETVAPSSSRRDCPTAVNSFLAVIVSADAFASADKVLQATAEVARFVGSSEPLPADHQYRFGAAQPPMLPEERERVLLPGERERLVGAKRGAEGIPVDPGMWDELVQAGRLAGVDPQELDRIAGWSAGQPAAP